MQTVPSRPQFLGIGAQKAGTTWLWAQLQRHPNVWMPPRKEVHYFDRNFPTPNYLGEPRLLRRIFGRETHHRAWREMMQADFRQSWKAKDLKALRWYSRFYFGALDDDWYRALFPKDEHLMCGEITPAYSILAEEDVAHIARLLPELKIILLLRNPIDRAWSQIRFDWTRGARADITNLEEIKAFIDSPKQSLRSSYLRMLEIWGRHFPPERFLVGFYDDITTQPAHLLERVTQFLGLESAPATPQDLGRKVHASREAPMPPEIRAYLIEKYAPDLRLLEERFGAPVSEWLASAQAAK
ncbi:MAG: Sulfotransferase family [Chthoniobacteraceae bacterium]|nr:Sulfotransferase family [Chthoniobacteraceae bacterium]